MDKIPKRAEEQLHLSNQYFLILFFSAKSLEKKNKNVFLPRQKCIVYK